ncbi:MAG: hypothetical protein V7753_16070, partial [Pseudoalteromonas distincta]
SAISYQLSAISYQLSAIKHIPCTNLLIFLIIRINTYINLPMLWVSASALRCISLLVTFTAVSLTPGLTPIRLIK